MVEIGHKIDRIVDRIGSQGQVNWGWITAGVVALGAFITLYTQPLVQENEDQDRAIATLTEKQYSIREEQIKEHARIQAEHEMMMRELNKLRGFHE